VVDQDQRVARLARLEPFVGGWRIEAPTLPFPPELADAARTTFEWALGAAFLLQRSSVPVPQAPDVLTLTAPAATVTPSTRTPRCGFLAALVPPALARCYVEHDLAITYRRTG
jgi:hypothetical protein